MHPARANRTDPASATVDAPHELQRFLDAQTPIYPHVLSELAQGQKATHWMWFVFPQIEGLGASPTSRRYAIRTLEEARAYLEHPLLGSRLRECTRLVNAVRGRSIHEIFGYPDDLKFHACMTLFVQADPHEPVFVEALNRFFGGQRHAATLMRLARV